MKGLLTLALAVALILMVVALVRLGPILGTVGAVMTVAILWSEVRDMRRP